MFERNDRNNRSNSSFRDVPVNVGEEYDVKIEDMGRSGDGIAKIDGYILFVPNTKKGDEVKIKVTETKRNLGFAELVE
jgi:predicted RNA-binding protein with TRAM domain